jgi:hypothetical protein
LWSLFVVFDKAGDPALSLGGYLIVHEFDFIKDTGFGDGGIFFKHLVCDFENLRRSCVDLFFDIDLNLGDFPLE